MGHAMRSRVVLEYLVSQGHEVEIMASGRAVEFLQRRFDAVKRIRGFHIIYEHNRVRRGKTFLSNVALAASLPQNIAAYFELIREFKPEVVISDFESWTYVYAKMHGLPIISVDNMQIINRCTHDPEVIDKYETDFRVIRLFIKGKLPFCSHYIITSFFRPPLRKPKTTLCPPILRPEILAAERSDGDHLLVYQTAEGNEVLVETLQKTGIPCRIYGMRRSITEDQVEGNLCYRPFSEEQFIADLASSQGVIAGGGFTLMGEAVYLHKPMLAVPVEHQFEQNLNARYWPRARSGREAAARDDPHAVRGFIEAIPECKRNLEGYSQNGNEDVFRTLDELLDRAAAGVLE